MKKKLFWLFVSFAVLLSGCGAGTVSAPASDESVMVVDHLGKSVTLPKRIERVAVCDVFPLPALLSVFFGSAERLAVIPPSSRTAAENSLLAELYPEILQADTSPVSGSSVNLEELMKAKPQVVFYNADNPSLGEALEKAGFCAVAVSVNSWDYDAAETLCQWLDLLTRIFPDSAAVQTERIRDYCAETEARIRERVQTLAEAEKKKIFFLVQYSADSLVTAGRNAFGQWWAEQVGAIPASEELTQSNSAKVTMEQIYLWNPDMVFLTNFTTALPQDLYDNTIGNYDWSGIRAVQNRAVHKMPLGLYRSYTPGVDTPLTLLWLAKTVYPERFADCNLTEEAMRYYETVFGIRLSEEQAESIFSPVAAAGKIDF